MTPLLLLLLLLLLSSGRVWIPRADNTCRLACVFDVIVGDVTAPAAQPRGCEHVTGARTSSCIVCLNHSNRRCRFEFAWLYCVPTVIRFGGIVNMLLFIEHCLLVLPVQKTSFSPYGDCCAYLILSDQYDLQCIPVHNIYVSMLCVSDAMSEIDL